MCTAALTVDLQDLSCHVGVGQRHMLHAAGVSDPIIPSVHLELEATPHCEWFSCGIHLLNACGEPEKMQRLNRSTVCWWIINHYCGTVKAFAQTLHRMNKFIRCKKPEKQKTAYILGKTLETWNFISRCYFEIDSCNVFLFFFCCFSASPLRERSLGLWKSSQSRKNSERRAVWALTRLVGCVCS